MKVFVYLFVLAMLVALGFNIYYYNPSLEWNSEENSVYVLGGLSSVVALLGSVLWLTFYNLNNKVKGK